MVSPVNPSSIAANGEVSCAGGGTSRRRRDRHRRPKGERRKEAYSEMFRHLGNLIPHAEAEKSLRAGWLPTVALIASITPAVLHQFDPFRH